MYVSATGATLTSLLDHGRLDRWLLSSALRISPEKERVGLHHMALRISVTQIDAINEATDRKDTSEVLMLVALLPVDRAEADRHVYSSEPHAQTSAFHHANFDTDESFNMGQLNNSWEFKTEQGIAVEVLLILKEVDLGADIEKIASDWDKAIASGLPKGSAQGNGGTDLQSYAPLTTFGSPDQAEILGIDIFEVGTTTEEVEIPHTPPVGEQYLDAASAKVSSDEAFGTDHVNQFFHESNRDLRQVRSYYSDANSTSYDVHFRFELFEG